MKKFLSLLLIMLLSFSMVACGGDSSNEGDVSVKESTENKEAPEEPKEADFEEITVVDNEECTIKITGIEEDDMWGYTLKAYLENKSADKVYMFTVDNASINGVDTDPLFATEVAAGKKANADISFSDTNLDQIGDFTDIEVSFRVYDSVDWEADAVAEEAVHIYPYGESSATIYVRESSDSDIVLVDNEHVKAVVIGFVPDDIFGFTLNMYLENKTDAAAMFSIEDASINGYMSDPFFADEVSAGNCAFASASWSALKEEGITVVEDVEFILNAYNSEDWDAEKYATESVSLSIG